MSLPTAIAVQQVQDGIIPITALPDEWLGKSGKSESFADLMSQLSESQTLRTTYAVSEPGAELVRPGSGVGVNGHQATERPVRMVSRSAVHPQPFTQTNAVGGCFGMPGMLRPRSLTPWQQERAVTPQRSWHASPMACVQRSPPGSAQSSPCLTNPAAPSSPLSGTLRPGQNHWRSSGLVRHMDTGDEDLAADEVLTPVRRSASQTCSSRPPIKSQSSSAPFNHQRPASDQCQISQRADEGELHRLQERRRRLASELTRTERELKEVAGSHTTMAYATMPGGGGGAMMRRRPAPSAGGPFAGKKTNMARTLSDHCSKSFNQKAADSYSYLGPGSDGPPLGEIHALWA